MTDKRISLEAIGTEQVNPRTKNIDQISTKEMVRLINQEDHAVIKAVEEASDTIAQSIDAIVVSLNNGGRLVYMGAGTSGRLGVLDASECLPTFGVGEEKVIALIAGGDHALRHPVEAAEDNRSFAVSDLQSIHFNSKDILCAIASSGRTPYCLAGIEYAKALGSKTIALTCTADSPMAGQADIAIEAIVGEEVITGSTRMKSGSAQKMVLNMLSTGTMIKLGKVYQNQMVDLRATNAKLVERARKMVIYFTGCEYERAVELLAAANNHVKSAIVMELLSVDFAESTRLLQSCHGSVQRLLDRYQAEKGIE